MIVPLLLMTKLLAILAIVQGIEFLRLHKVVTNHGAWRWSDLEAELGGGNRTLRYGLGLALGSSGFFVLNVLRLISAAVLLVTPNASAMVILLMIHVFTLLRWLGTFNGGSDYMNLMLLMGASVALVGQGHANLVRGVLWYISIQLCLSYGKAGFYKLKDRQWQTGVALKDFLCESKYESAKWINHFCNSQPLMWVGSWLVILFEVSFPLSLISRQMAGIYIVLGVLFHFTNVYLFGLNRFLLAWGAAYPALYFCAL